MVQVALFPPVASAIPIGGQAVTVAIGPVAGGFITNPLRSTDQGVSPAEDLYVSTVGAATLFQSGTTTRLPPGNTFSIPAGMTTNLTVNAATSGHRFSGVIFQPPPGFVPPSGPFPPSGPTTLTKTIDSYLYQQYSDDDDLQAFVDSFNALAQEYVSWFASIGLPVYTGDAISGALLDWVAQGIYGMARPVLTAGRARLLGPFNTFQFNTIPFNVIKRIGPPAYFATSDDIFKRCMTWNFFKGDGRTVNVRWVKRRVMRFLLGTNGSAPNIDNTYQISVSFGIDSQINIRLLNGLRTVVGGAIFNRAQFNTAAFNQIKTTFQAFAPLANAAVFKEAMDAGVLQMPFQFSTVVDIG